MNFAVRDLSPGQCPQGTNYYVCSGFKGCCSVSVCENLEGACPDDSLPASTSTGSPSEITSSTSTSTPSSQAASTKSAFVTSDSAASTSPTASSSSASASTFPTSTTPISPPSSSPAAANGQTGGLPVAATAGIIGGSVALALIVAIICCVWWSRRKVRNEEDSVDLDNVDRFMGEKPWHDRSTRYNAMNHSSPGKPMTPLPDYLRRDPFAEVGGRVDHEHEHVTPRRTSTRVAPRRSMSPAKDPRPSSANEVELNQLAAPRAGYAELESPASAFSHLSPPPAHRRSDSGYSDTSDRRRPATSPASRQSLMMKNSFECPRATLQPTVGEKKRDLYVNSWSKWQDV